MYYENMFMELYASAYKTVDLLASVKSGEKVLVLADTAINRKMLECIVSAAHVLGGEAALIIYETRKEVNMEPPAHVSAAMEKSDVIISFPLMYILHTKAYINALRAGARILELTGMDPEMMIRLIGKVDYETMCKLGEKLKELTMKARKIRIETPKGTLLEFENDPKRPVFHNDGIVKERGIYKPLGGQVSWAPLEETINGVIVADGFIWPPKDLGVLKQEVKLIIENGKIIDIKGGRDADTFRKWLKNLKDDKMYYVAHASWGFYPNAKLRGIPLEDERIYATIEFGFGSQSPKFKGNIGFAKAHTDVNILNPIVYFDDKLIVKDGRFIHPELVELDKKLKE